MITFSQKWYFLRFMSGSQTSQRSRDLCVAGKQPWIGREKFRLSGPYLGQSRNSKRVIGDMAPVESARAAESCR
jgi:hypothetical protein